MPNQINASRMVYSDWKTLKDPVKCEHCDKKCSTAVEYHRHVRNHAPRKYPCDICGKMFKFRYHVEIHKKGVHIKQPAIYPCEVCEKSFVTKSILSIHKMIHSKDYKFKCDQCDRGYHRKPEFQQHYDAEHLGIRHICKHCSKVFKDIYAYKRHILSHSPSYVKREYKCDICCKILARRSEHRNHMRRHNGEGARHICDVCGKSVTTAGSLRDHMMVHSGKKPELCGTCGKGFTNKKLLATHERTHTKERPFVCNVCNKSFTQRSTLTVHMRSHTGEKPYKCEICNKNFVTKTLMKYHSKVHGFQE